MTLGWIDCIVDSATFFTEVSKLTLPDAVKGDGNLKTLDGYIYIGEYGYP